MTAESEDPQIEELADAIFAGDLDDIRRLGASVVDRALLEVAWRQGDERVSVCNWKGSDPCPCCGRNVGRPARPPYPYAIEAERSHPGSAFFGDQRRLIWIDGPEPADPSPYPRFRLWRWWPTRRRRL